MKFKVGDIVRVKTYDELEESTYGGGDWDWPYTYSQGVKGKIIKIERVNGNFKIFLRFNFHEMFIVNPCVDDRCEDATYILEENENTPYCIEELVALKNKILDLE